jgi:hypothetical protein
MRTTLLAFGLVWVLAAVVAVGARERAGYAPALHRIWPLLLTAAALNVVVAAVVVVRDRGSGGDHQPVRAAARIELTSATVQVGGTYRITGTGFAAVERVGLYWADRDGAAAGLQAVLGKTTADAAGRVPPVIVKEAADPARYVIMARGLTSGRTASRPLTVTAARVAPAAHRK